MPSTQASDAPGRTICDFALPPVSRSSEWASTVLPAPVSPVIAFSPAPSRSSARSIRSRFSIRSSRSIGIRFSNAPGPTRRRFPLAALGGWNGVGWRGALLRGAGGHQISIAGQDEAEQGAGEGDDRADQEDLVEAADEGDLCSFDCF